MPPPPPKLGQESSEAPSELRLSLPMPPSANKIYRKNKWGGLCLSKEATLYKEKAKGVVSSPDTFPKICNFPTGIETVYGFYMKLYFESVENEGWYITDNNGEKRAKTRYKRIDYDNRIKFLQDCVASALGIDDCQIFKAEQEKRQDHINPRADIVIKVLDINQFLRSDP